MSIKLADLVVFLGADTGDLDNALGNAQGKTTSWANNLGGTATKLIGGAVVSAAAAAAAAVVGIGAAAFSTASQIDSATARARSALGLTEEQATAFGETVRQVYGNNFGDSIDDVGAGLITAQQNLSDLRRTGEDLGVLTQHAFAIRDAFGVDVAESTRTADQLMKNFGISGEEALGIVAAGFQKGLNVSDDLSDTLIEYAADFDGLGFTADQVLSTLNSGLGAGIYNTDKIGDAFREFKINMLDVGRLAPIEGLNADLNEAIRLFRNGETTGVEAFTQIQGVLQDIEDPLQRQQIGVALMGSMWEDLGADAILAIDTASDSLTDNSDVLDSLNAQYETLGEAFNAIKRRALTALAPIGGKMLELVNNAMPAVQAGFDWFESKLPGIMSFVENVMGGAGEFINNEVVPRLMAFGDWWQNVAWPAIQPFLDNVLAQLIPGLQQLGMWVGSILAADFTILKDVIGFVSDNFNIFGPILAAIGIAILALTAPVALIIGAIVLLATAWANNWGGIQEKAAAAGEFLAGIWEGIKAAFEFLGTALQSIFAIFAPAIEGNWVQFGANLRTAMGNAVKLLIRIWIGLPTMLIGLAVKAAKAASDAFKGVNWGAVGRAIIQGIASGITASLGIIKRAAIAAASAALDAAKGFLGISSPSTEAREKIGKPFGEGVALGVSDMLGAVQGAVKDLVSLPSIGSGLQPVGAVAAGGRAAGGLHIENVSIQLARLPETDGEAEEGVTRFWDAVERRGAG